MANDSGIGDWLGKLGLGTTAMAILTWAAQVDLWILPLVAWLLALLMRVRGTHFVFWPALNTHVDDLTKSGDLHAAFPGSGAQRRLRVLFEARGRSSRVAKVQAATQALDRGLAKWFGNEVLSPEAFNRSLTFAFFYPIVLLLLVWLVRGQGRLGSVEVLPASWSLVQRMALLMFGLGVFIAAMWPFHVFMRAGGRRKWLYCGFAMCAAVVAIVGIVVLAATAAFVAAGPSKGAGTLTAAVAGAISLVVAFAVAGTFVGAVAVVGTSAFGGAIVVAGAVAGASAVGSAGVGVGAIAVSGLVAGVGAFAGASVVFFAAQYLLTNSAKRFSISQSRETAVLQIAAWLVGLTLFAWWLPGPTNMHLLSAGSPVFLVFFFLGVVPVWNAILDLASVALTRLFLRRYLRNGHGWWWMLVADLLLAVALTVLLFWGLLAALLAMQHWGWSVPADDLVRHFRANPADPQVSWLTWMALTNVLPTLAHLGLAFFGLATGWIYRDEVFANELQLKREAPPASPIVGVEAPAQTSEGRLLLKAPLSKTQATKLVNWVYVDVWLVSLLPLVLALSAWPAWRWLMRQAMDWLPV